MIQPARALPGLATLELGAETQQLFLTAAIGQCVRLGIGIARQTDNPFREHNFTTTWGTGLLTIGEPGGRTVIL